jgi:DNA-binding NtrC family response regulator
MAGRNSDGPVAAPSSSTLWIVHRDSRQRAALARLSGAGENTILGAPSNEIFESASPADVVLLAPSGDFESELEFVHRTSPRMPRCRWILLSEMGDYAEVQRLFDVLPAQFMRFPPDPDRLRRSIRGALRHRGADSLSRRRGRDRLAARFSRWFADLNLPDLLRALDPRLSHLPLLVRGEVGTGRGLLVRYVQAFGTSDDGALRHIPCRGITSERELLAQIGATRDEQRNWCRTIWLEGVELLPVPLQSVVRDWIGYGLPDGTLRASALRWIATTDDDLELDTGDDPDHPRLTRDLADALSGLVIRIPPMRLRQATIESFVEHTAHAWSASHGERPRPFGEAAMQELVAHPWPGNMAELETVVTRSLSLSTAEPIETQHLRFHHGEAPWSISESEIADPFDSGIQQELEPAIEEVEEEEEVQGIREEEPEPLEALEAARLDARQTDAPLPSDPSSNESNDESVRRLVGALAHEVRNPLVSIRTFAELLPENFDDPEFRSRYTELVGNDVRRIEGVVTRLQDLAQNASSRREPVDVAALLDSLLDRSREEIQARRLLVLKELDRTTPFALGDPAQLERALGSVVQKTLEMVAERGDVYLASKHNPSGRHDGPTMRVLLRYHNPAGPLMEPEGFRLGAGARSRAGNETTLDYVIAERMIRAQGGTLTLDTTDAQETVVVIDLPAPKEG